MSILRIWLCFLLAMCCVALITASPLVYEEPNLEVNTAEAIENERDGSADNVNYLEYYEETEYHDGMASESGDKEMEDDGSGDKEIEDDGSGDKEIEDDGSGDKEMEDDGSGDKDMEDDGLGEKENEDGGSGDKEMEDDGSEDKEMEDDGSGNKDMEDAGSGDGKEMEDDGSSDDNNMDSDDDQQMEDELIVDKMVMDDGSKTDMDSDSDDNKDEKMKKINDVEEESGGEESEEDESSSSSEEDDFVIRGCTSSNEIQAILDTMNNNDTFGNKTCQLTETLHAMVKFLSVLSSEMKELRQQVRDSCTGSDAKDQDEEYPGMPKLDGSLDNITVAPDYSDEDIDDSEEMITTTVEPEPTTPAPPTACPPPFQLLASGCYYIQTDSREWRSWGDAHAFCQQQGGTLAAPYRTQELRDYLTQSYSNVFWVGARNSEDGWVWLTGRPVEQDDWKKGKPSKQTARRCVYLDYWNGYKGVNHFCGEKFSFICEHSGQ